MPVLAPTAHLVIVHDMSDSRYSSEEERSYGENGLWKGDSASGATLQLGIVDSNVEQSIAVLDFATRNRVTLGSADHSLRTELSAVKQAEMRNLMGDELF